MWFSLFNTFYVIFTFQHFLCDFHFSTFFMWFSLFNTFFCDFHFSTLFYVIFTFKHFYVIFTLQHFFFFLTDWPCYVVGQCTRSFDRSSLSSHLARDTFLKWTLANFAVRRRCKYIIVNFCDTLTRGTLGKNSLTGCVAGHNGRKWSDIKHRPKINMRYHGTHEYIMGSWEPWESCWISHYWSSVNLFIAFNIVESISKSKFFFFLGGGGQKDQYCSSKFESIKNTLCGQAPFDKVATKVVATW